MPRAWKSKRKATCHPEKDYYSNGFCRSCYEKDLRLRNPEYAQRQRDNSNAWPGEKRAISSKRTYVKSKFGITLEEYYAYFANDAKCELCGGIAHHLDHDHITGRIRGVLCGPCNQAIHKAERDIEWLDRARVYLRS